MGATLAAAAGIGRCDASGCAIPTIAGLVALSRNPDSLAEDCARATILVSVAVVTCKGPRFVADSTRAARDEGYALWFTPSLQVKSVRGWRGERPWVK